MCLSICGVAQARAGGLASFECEGGGRFNAIAVEVDGDRRDGRTRGAEGQWVFCWIGLPAAINQQLRPARCQAQVVPTVLVLIHDAQSRASSMVGGDYSVKLCRGLVS